jgi:23S rRNA (pseudouridine1915-N3)-methyltransferase
MPSWVDEGWRSYARRMPPACPLELVEVAPARRSRKQPMDAVLADEAKRLQALARGRHQVVLDERGRQFDSRQLAGLLGDWLEAGRDVALLIGGADGLAPEIRQSAACLWSLSRLTLPHGLVRVLLAEQLYRAWTLSSGHPYHRD